MRINLRKLFTMSVSESEYFNETQDKIEYTGNNKQIEKICLTYLPAINAYFRESDHYYRIKEFDKSIDALEHAYDLAGEIREEGTLECILFFQATVTQTLEGIHEELARMSKGLFGTHRYDAQFERADMLLKKFKKTGKVKPEYSTVKSTSNVLQPAYI